MDGVNARPSSASSRALGRSVLAARAYDAMKCMILDQEIAPGAHLAAARQFRQALSTYQQHRDLIAIGAYQRGSDPRVDQALALWPRMQGFLQQDMRERVDLAASLHALEQTLSEPVK